MRSYASIESTTAGFVECELELCEYTGSVVGDFSKETMKISIPENELKMAVGNYEPGEVIIIFHYNGSVQGIIRKSDDERQRRIEYLNAM